MVEFDSYPEIKKALLAGTIDAMSTDGAILAGYVDSQTVMLPKRYTQEPYGIATKKGNDDLRQLVEQLILDMEKSGELRKLQDKWGIRVGS
jgi:putative glutamine transport system substrate-binding protein